MGALVVEDLTQLAAEVQALKVPAVEVQRIAMHEQQSEIIVDTLIHLGVEHDAVGGGDVGPIGRSEKNSCRSASELRVIRLAILRSSSIPNAIPPAASAATLATSPNPAASRCVAAPSDVLRSGVEIASRHARSNSGHDLVADGVAPGRPLASSWLAAITRAEQDDVLARLGDLFRTQLNDELVHADPPRTGTRPPDQPTQARLLACRGIPSP